MLTCVCNARTMATLLHKEKCYLLGSLRHITYTALQVGQSLKIMYLCKLVQPNVSN